MVPSPTLQVAVVKGGAGVAFPSRHLVVRISKGRGTRRTAAACGTGVVLEGDVGHWNIDGQIRTFDARCEFKVRRGEPHGRLEGRSTDDGGHIVGRVCRRNRWRTADGARAAVDGQAGWERR